MTNNRELADGTLEKEHFTVLMYPSLSQWMSDL